jgi:hypothetical protein
MRRSVEKSVNIGRRNNHQKPKKVFGTVYLTLDDENMKDKLLYNPDEFLLDDIKFYHYEEMSPEHKWMSFTWEDGRIGHLNIFLKDGKIETRYEEWSDETSN